MSAANVSVEIKGSFPAYYWVVLTEKPVRRLFRSLDSFPTRTDAMRHFQQTCELVGWSNDATEVPLS